MTCKHGRPGGREGHERMRQQERRAAHWQELQELNTRRRDRYQLDDLMRIRNNAWGEPNREPRNREPFVPIGTLTDDSPQPTTRVRNPILFPTSYTAAQPQTMTWVQQAMQEVQEMQPWMIIPS